MAKQAEIVSLLGRRLLPELKRRFGYDGDVRAATGPETDSPAVRIVQVALWPSGGPGVRIEVPVEITRIPCRDPLAVRTADGVVYPTRSDADLVESKVIAIFNRHYIEYRDVVDLFLFSGHLLPDSAERLQNKLAALALDRETVQRILRDLDRYPDHHVRGIAAVIGDQLEPDAAANIEAAGGARLVLETVRNLLLTGLGLGEERGHEGA